jgi:hypothetical protein
MGIAFDIFVVGAGLFLGLNVCNFAYKAHSIMGMAWRRMDDGTFNRGARLPLVLGTLPFSVFRIFFLVACVGGGIVALVAGPR